MKTKINVKIPPFLATYVALLFNNAQAGAQYATTIIEDRNCPGGLFREDLRHIKYHFSEIIRRVEKRIAVENREVFKQEVRSSDPVILDNIHSLFARMNAEQRATLETVAEAILRKEFLIEHIEKVESA